MPPQLQQLLENRRMLAIIGGGVALLIIIVVVAAMQMNGPKAGESRRLNDKEMILATVDSMGRAIEMQALLAREKIQLVREDAEGGKFILKFQEEATLDERDRAMITLVQSGLMDKNVGLELFDKGDLTASREEKRIKLIRARNGEIARLIRKIDPIQDASVFISMPEPTIFKRDQEPISATIQVTLAPGDHLNRDKVRSIINLLVGSIENLDAKHVSLTDTNGNVYNSVLDTSDELMDKLEERDRYMEQKVKTQLDRLLGANKYAVTVSTYLREASREEMTLSYDPDGSAVAKSSAFNERLNSQQKGPNATAGGAVSSILPDELSASAGTSSSEQSARGYNRNGQELEYNSGKRQVSETLSPGMLEQISIAVTLDSGVMPQSMSPDELKSLVAHAASPLVDPENVTIVANQGADLMPLSASGEGGNSLTVGAGVVGGIAGVAWWVWAIASVVVLMLFGLLMRLLGRSSSVTPAYVEQQQREINQLRDLANQQAQQLQETQRQAQEMLQAQQQQLAQLASQPQAQAISQQALPQQTEAIAMTNTASSVSTMGAEELKNTLSELQAMIQQNDTGDMDEEDFKAEIKSWIEST